MQKPTRDARGGPLAGSGSCPDVRTGGLRLNHRACCVCSRPMLLHLPPHLRMLHMGPTRLLFPCLHAPMRGPRLDLCLLCFLRLLLTPPLLPHACTRAQQLQQTAAVVGLTATSAAPDLVLQYLDEILCNIRLKHQKNVPLQNICNIQIKHLKHMYENT
jgi:hypothetical protein